LVEYHVSTDATSLLTTTVSPRALKQPIKAATAKVLICLIIRFICFLGFVTASGGYSVWKNQFHYL
jgi:hypothetical protein